MDVIIFEKEAYLELHRDLMQKMYEAIREAKEEALRNVDPSNDWISPSEAHELLGVKSKTKMQELRDMEEIRYSIAGRIIKYSKSSILEYLNRNVPFY